jgi:hypothetical protein
VVVSEATKREVLVEADALELHPGAVFHVARAKTDRHARSVTGLHRLAHARVHAVLLLRHLHDLFPQILDVAGDERIDGGFVHLHADVTQADASDGAIGHA